MSKTAVARKIMLGAFVCAMNASAAFAQSDRPQTIREFLAECANKTGDQSCPVSLGSFVTLQALASGPYCSGNPPKDVNATEKSDAELSVMGTSIIEWLNAHPRYLDMDTFNQIDLSSGLPAVFGILFPCKK